MILHKVFISLLWILFSLHSKASEDKPFQVVGIISGTKNQSNVAVLKDTKNNRTYVAKEFEPLEMNSPFVIKSIKKGEVILKNGTKDIILNYEPKITPATIIAGYEDQPKNVKSFVPEEAPPPSHSFEEDSLESLLGDDALLPLEKEEQHSDPALGIPYHEFSLDNLK